MEYNRLVAYIYSYSEGIKGDNAGFAKIELRDDIIKMKITMKKGCVNGNTRGNVFMYYRSEGVVNGIKLGEFAVNNFGGNFEYVGSGIDIEENGVSFTDICGLYIEIDGKNKYVFASEWDDEGFVKDAVRAIKLKAAEIPVENLSEAKTENSAPQATVNPIWDELRSQREGVEIFADDNFFDIVEIAPSDIEKMPNANWGLLNNSFVNYGYNIFRHLIVGSYIKNGEKKHFIGIPGVYNRRERLTAGMYGFDHFKFSMRSDIRLSQFGYWYKELEG